MQSDPDGRAILEDGRAALELNRGESSWRRGGSGVLRDIDAGRHPAREVTVFVPDVNTVPRHAADNDAAGDDPWLILVGSIDQRGHWQRRRRSGGAENLHSPGRPAQDA